MGLLDSGATHALRPVKPGEITENYRRVQINLAGGRQVPMKMSSGGVLVGVESVEPIIPLGRLIEKLGCTMQWTEGHLVLVHPAHGQIQVDLKDGCPMVEKRIAMKLIDELEEVGQEVEVRAMTQEDPYFEWLRRVAQDHPAFQGIPEEVREKLVEKPVPGIETGNRRQRRLWRREGGVIVYLYSGKNEGYTLRRAVRECGGDHRKVIEVDIENGQKWDMVSGGMYRELLYMALQGQIAAVVSSPNCRTRSKLRHIPVPGVDLPGPSRKWGGEEWGLSELGEMERRKCFEDDLMLFRAVMLYVVAEECAKAEGREGSTDFLLEHPQAPEDVPEVVSFWRTRQWKNLQRSYKMKEVHLDQGELGGEGK